MKDATSDGPTGLIEHRIHEIGLELPPSSTTTYPWYSYVVQADGHLYGAGTGPILNGVPLKQGMIGREYSVEEGIEINRYVALKVLRAIKDAIGDLDLIDRPLMINNHINVAPEFDGDWWKVERGSAELFSQLWHEYGPLAIMPIEQRLPLNVPTAISSIWRLKP